MALQAPAMTAKDGSKAKQSMVSKPAMKKPTTKPEEKKKPEKKPAMEQEAMTKGQLQAILGPRFEQDPESEPFAGHLALHCTKPGCKSWVWFHKLYHKSHCSLCGQRWFQSFTDQGCQLQWR